MAPLKSAARLEAFKLQDHAPDLVPSASTRAWMDAFPDHHSYRCLPLAIANAHGWDVSSPITFEVTWNGGPSVGDLTIRAFGPLPNEAPLNHFARSNFSRGILTLHTGYLFRTPPGWNLLATGPFNQPKPGIYPLTGIVECDWLPYPFTMNWQMLNPGTVRFERGEPFCTIMPVPKHYLEEWEIIIHHLSDDPVLDAEHQTFRQEREQFMTRLTAKEPEAIKQAWQRHYFVGRHPDGTKVENHVKKVRLAEPQNQSGMRPLYAKDTPASALAAELLAQKNKDPAAAIQPTQHNLTSLQLSMTNVTQSFKWQTASQPLRPWRAGSILNELNQNQNERNHAGRRRLNKGTLTPSEDTFNITRDTDASALDFVFAPNFLDLAECELLADTAQKLADRQHVEGIKDPYWQGRVLFFADIAAATPKAADVMRQTINRITERLQRFYDLTAPIYADVFQLVQWREGMLMEPHADRANPDGSPHGMPHRDFASIVYLNDDYVGGEFYFTGLDMVVKPETGTLMAFTGGWHHEHAVLKVTRGLRLTMPAFYTFDAVQKDRTIYA